MIIHLHKYTALFALGLGAVISIGIFSFGLRNHNAQQPIFGFPKVITFVAQKVAPQPTPQQPKRLSPVPQTVKAVYLTAWSAGNPKTIDTIINLADTTELNGVVIDIKDYTGRVMFETTSDAIKKLGAEQIQIPNFKDLIEKLHSHNIYVIARIAGFQDVYLAEHRPELAVRNAYTGAIWRDKKNLAWVDPANTEVWDYLIDISNQAINLGVDEINFDYIRFPSDGDISLLAYPTYDATKLNKAKQIKAFFAYISEHLGQTDAKLSLDLFGLSTVSTTDMGIGQVLEYALPYFDYVSPMVYPSHYANGSFGYKNPAVYPYEIVFQSMSQAELRRAKLLQSLASTTIAIASATQQFDASEKNNTIKPDTPLGKFRPWLQAFDLGAVYTPDMVRKQIQATYDAHATSGWYLWNPTNTYDPTIFLKK